MIVFALSVYIPIALTGAGWLGIGIPELDLDEEPAVGVLVDLPGLTLVRSSLHSTLSRTESVLLGTA